MRAFSGVTVGLAGSVVGVHWSLGLSATCLLVAMAVLLWRRLSTARHDAAA